MDPIAALTLRSSNNPTQHQRGLKTTIHTTPPPNCILSYNFINLYIPFLIPIKKPQNQVGCEQPTAFHFGSYLDVVLFEVCSDYLNTNLTGLNGTTYHEILRQIENLSRTDKLRLLEDWKIIIKPTLAAKR
jgi:hypothetical protein